MLTRKAVTDVGYEGVPPRIRNQIAKYRADAPDSVAFRMFGVVGLGVVALLSAATLPGRWPDVGAIAGALAVLVLAAGLAVWLSRSRAVRMRAIETMRVAAMQGPWVQGQVIEAREVYFGRVQRKWSFVRARLEIAFVDPRTGQRRRLAQDTFMHHTEMGRVSPGAVVHVRLHPDDPSLFFVPPLA